MKYKACVLDVFVPKVRDVIAEVMSDKYELEFADSYDRQEQLDLAARADFLIAGWPRVDGDMISQAKNLKVIHKWGIGLDKIDLAMAKQKGVKVYLTGGANAVPVSEQALMLIMAALRRLSYVDASLRKGNWLKSEMRSVAHHLSGKAVGIVGMGNIGRNLAKLLKGFDCKIYYYDIYRASSEVEEDLGLSFRQLEDLLEESDVVSLHSPLTEDTRHMINERTLGLMKREAVLVNTARGGLVDEKALTEALKNGVIAAAGLDVFEKEPVDVSNPLLSMDNVVVSPHVAGATFNNVKIVAKRVRKNIDTFLTGGQIAASDIAVD